MIDVGFGVGAGCDHPRRWPTSTPPELLRTALAAGRDSGRPFGQAWPAALTAALKGAQTVDERDSWTAALSATADSWEAAYGLQDAPACERALAALGTDPERVVKLATTDGPLCDQCGNAIPPAKKDRRARYCSRVCQRAANGRRVTAAA